jgi:hypothetical protein
MSKTIAADVKLSLEAPDAFAPEQLEWRTNKKWVLYGKLD